MRSTLNPASALLAALPVATLAKCQGPYKPTWESTDAHNASPEWFRDAKFGVYWHWGAFTTPQYGSEWYGRDMYLPDSNVRQEHTRRYGPPEEWGYNNFIDGADDLEGNHVQFKPVLASEGGDFDPAAWMKVVNASGARFAGPVGEHHDGYSLWASEVNEWNTADRGPKLDLVKIFADLVREYDMKLVVAMHQAFNTNGFFEGASNQTDHSLQKLFGKLPKEESDQLWFDKHRDMLDHVQPDIIWNDFSLDSPGYCQDSGYPCNIAEEQRLRYLAYYFNRGVEWDKEVLTTYKHFDDGFRNTSAVADWERGGPAEISRPYWLTDDAISASSWSYTEGIEYYSSKQMVHSLLDRISKNGNMLLNISPTAVGVIPQEQEQVLLDIGTFLARYGEAVYSTRAWDIYGQGPTKAGGGSFTAPMEGNSSDIRFTKSKANDILYATVLGWPSEGEVAIESLGSDALVSLSGLKSVQLLGDAAGQYTDATWNQESDALVIQLPEQPAESLAYVLKLTFDDSIPVPQPAVGVSVFSEPKAEGKGVTLGEGQFRFDFITEAGLAPEDIRFLRVSDGSMATVYSDGNTSEATKTYEAGEHVVDAGSVGSISIARA